MKFQTQRRLPRYVTAPCDKLSAQIFSWTPEEYLIVLEFGAACIEDKKGVVKVEYRLKLLEGYEDKLPPDARHREVLFALMELYEAGFSVVTPAQVVRHMTGSAKVSVNWKELKPIIDKLMMTLVEIDLSPLEKLSPRRKDSYKKRFQEPKYKDYREITGTLLPAQYFKASVNGQETITIKMLDESPLMKVADFKRQKIRYDRHPLAIPNKHDTNQQTVIKCWLLRRINLAKTARGKNMNPSILFKTLYAECGLADANYDTKRDIRSAVTAILEYFKASGGVMRDFEIVKSGRVYRSIKIIF